MTTHSFSVCAAQFRSLCVLFSRVTVTGNCAVKMQYHKRRTWVRRYRISDILKTNGGRITQHLYIYKIHFISINIC